MTSSRPPSLRELNRTLLARQLLLERRRVALRAAVRRLVALWSRLDGFRKEQLNRAFHAGTVVKATSLRLTLHVADGDHFGDFASA